MIVVVGMAFEARIVAAPGLQVVCSGDGRDLQHRLSAAIRAGCRGLISFGVAGGLAPQLKPGTCVVGSAVLGGQRPFATDPAWARRLLQTIPDAVHGPLAGVPSPVACSHAKRALHQRTGAVAVDMESHVVAGVAAAHAMPMAAIRVITDPAERTLPAAALAGMRADGRADVGAIVRALMRRPHDLPALLRTAFDARAARATLLRGRQLLGPTLGLPEFGELQLDVA